MIIKKDRGITLLISLIITSTLLVVAAAIVNTSIKQSALSYAGKESQYAFYAADTGGECAIYWDVKNPSGISAFATSTETSINCNGQPFTVGGNGNAAPVAFTITFNSDPYCAKVTVTKAPDGTTKIESLGYNTCDTTNPRRVQRAVRVSY